MWTVYENLLPVANKKAWDWTRAAETAPKLAAMAESIVESNLKTLVLLDSRPGMKRTDPHHARTLVRCAASCGDPG